jgi:peptidoglycan/xylan/chitin deacetylase (PgdA/CDA1 family)
MSSQLPFSVTRTLRNSVQQLAHYSGYSLRRARAQGRARILMYHAVTPDGLAPQAFEKQLRFLRGHFDVVSLGVLCARHARHELRGNEVALTFDDGVRNHLSTVYPALERNKVCATYFVCPGRIERGEWIWNMEMRARLHALRRDEQVRLALEMNCPADDVEGIVAWAKGRTLDVRVEAENRVRAATPRFVPSALQCDLSAPLSWTELRSFDPNFVTIGSHTVDHPILPMVDASTALHEIEQSRRQLEARLDRTVDLFCYPDGAHSAETIELVRRSYSAGVGTQPGLVADSDSIHHLPRIGAGERIAAFEWRLHRP